MGGRVRNERLSRQTCFGVSVPGALRKEKVAGALVIGCGWQKEKEEEKNGWFAEASHVSGNTMW